MDWLEAIAKKCISVPEGIGVQLQLPGGDEEPLLRYVWLKKQKGLVLIKESAEQLPLSRFLEKVPANVPICLSIEGKGVLHKKWEGEAGEEPLEKVLPHADKEAFYYTLFSTGSYSFMALARKEIIDKLLKSFQEKNCRLASVQLGSFAVQLLIPFLADAHTVRLGEKQWQTNGTSLLELEAGEAIEPNQLGEEVLPARLTLPYANAFQLFFGVEGWALSNLQAGEEWLQKALFDKLKIALPAFFFLLLLANFFTFSNLSAENEGLSSSLSQHQYQINKLADLNRQVAGQEKLYQTIGVGKQSFFSFYADRLVASIPDGHIRLNSLQLHPLQETKDRSLAFAQGMLRVEGQCNSPLKLNAWLELLEGEGWVKAISNRRFSTRQQDNQGAFSFEINLQQPW